MGAEMHPHGFSRAGGLRRRFHRAGVRQVDGVVVMSVQIPSWLLWTVAIPLGVLVFWFTLLCLCLFWAHMRRPR